ncbi:MAG: glycosyltransferase family 2 protein [Chitinophagaceae bacterium]|nr:MAG: glycosyltransferase family 2 protein [Chitinophagaceae bacterium]
MPIVFFISLFLLFYSYLGYGILLAVFLKIRKVFSTRKKTPEFPVLPPVTLIIAAYNEEDFILRKIKNTLELDYPEGMLTVMFVTDGSTDGTMDIISRYPSLTLLHQDGRSGKVAAMHRAIGFVKTPYMIFSDANTFLNPASVRNIVRHYIDPSVGGVAGEKKIMAGTDDVLTSTGEGLYWKYESWLKRMDSEFYTVVGAAGELFSVRTDLYESPGSNVLLDDFIISMRICQKGYRIVYEPQAFAMETASSNIKEEEKRKIRISAGAFQSIQMLSPLLNIFRFPRLSFQYISHRVLRWAVCPLLLPLALLLNIWLQYSRPHPVYAILLVAQLAFYLAAFAGFLLYKRKIKVSLLYVPYYFLFINISLYIGFARYLKGKQTVLWEKAKREEYKPVADLADRK